MEPEVLSIMQKLTDAVSLLQQGQSQVLRTKAPAPGVLGAPDVQLIFGPGGIFSQFGLDDVVINASLSPKGIASMIPAYGTNILYPIFAYITGFDSDGTDEPDGPCDPAPGGEIEACHQVAQFGRVARASKEMEVNELMSILNGRLSTELRVLGDVIGEGHPLLTQEARQPTNWIRSVIQTQLVIVGIEFQRWLVPTLWTGDPVNNTNGGYAEFPGLDILVNTGKVDAFKNIACPALDSDVKEFGYGDVSSSDPDIVEYLSSMEFYLRHIADRTGLSPVDWVIAMRPELFFELTSIWPCRYLTDRCANSNGTNVTVISDNGNVAMRDAMRNGGFLTINGRNIPVILDDGIPELNAATDAHLNPGEFASDIYFLPIRAKGMPVLFWEFLDYSQAMASVAGMAGLQPQARFWTTDGGRYMWTVENLRYCFKIQGKMEPRVLLRTPQLAGRVNHIAYSPLQHLRSPFPDSPYFKNGGSPSQDTPAEYYNEWTAPNRGQ
jgi:hypothetical protein